MPILRNLEVKSLHKKQENLTTALCVLREEHGDHGDFFKGFLSGLCLHCAAGTRVRSVVKSFLVPACPG
jgi:hypothetical protein